MATSTPHASIRNSRQPIELTPFDEQQRRMPDAVENPADARDIAGHAGRGLVVAGKHRLDPVGGVGAQPLFIDVERHTLAPRDLDRIDIESETAA